MTLPGISLLALVALLYGVAGPGRVAVAHADSGAAGDSSGAASLAPSTAAPWNPPSVIGPERPWESAVRLPLRVATLPLTLVGKGLEGTLLYVEETSLVPRVGVLLATLPRIGVAVAPASLGDRTGFGAAIRARPVFLKSVLGLDVDGSTRKYSHAGADLGYGPARLAYTYDWRPRERFFGYGMSTSDEQASTYALRTQAFRLGLAYPWQKRGHRPPHEQVLAWVGPREAILRRGREGPSFEERFPGTTPLLGTRQEQMRFGVGLSTDHRAGAPHWTHGARAAVQWERFDDVTRKTLAIKSPRDDSPDFTRVSGEAEGGFSFRRDPHTVRLALRVVNQSAKIDLGRLLLSDLMSLGGSQGLAGYEPGRFHDIDLMAAKLSYVFPLSRYLEFDVHAEAGGVYPDLKDATLPSLKSSYGVALRPRLDTVTLASFGVDWSSETLRIRYTLGGVE